MTTQFGSPDASALGGFVASPLGARNRGLSVIWLATRFDERLDPHDPQRAPGNIYEIDPATLEMKRWGIAPTPIVEGIGGDDSTIWYVDNKWSARDVPGEMPLQMWELSPDGWENGEVVPVRTEFRFPDHIWLHGVGGDNRDVWAFWLDEGGVNVHWLIGDFNPRSGFLGFLSVEAPPATMGVGGSQAVVYVCGNSSDSSVSNLWSKWPHTLATFRGGRLLPSPIEHGFLDVGGSLDTIWAVGEYQNNPYIYEIDPDQIDPDTGTYAIRRQVGMPFLDANRFERAYAIGGK